MHWLLLLLLTIIWISLSLTFPGHLMGKKSIERLYEKMEVSSDQLTPSDLSVATELDRYQGLLKELMLQKNLQNVMARSADWLHGKRASWREEERDKYLREVSLLMNIF